jgi:hypothetical protein
MVILQVMVVVVVVLFVDTNNMWIICHGSIIICDFEHPRLLFFGSSFNFSQPHETCKAKYATGSNAQPWFAACRSSKSRLGTRSVPRGGRGEGRG